MTLADSDKIATQKTMKKGAIIIMLIIPFLRSKYLGAHYLKKTEILILLFLVILICVLKYFDSSMSEVALLYELYTDTITKKHPLAVF